MLIIFGSINMDLNASIAEFPAAGQTAKCLDYKTTPGGKAANQALAAGRAGAKTALVGKVGDDGFGNRILMNLRRNEVMTSGVATSETLPTGLAVVMHDPRNEQRAIMHAQGANSEISADQVPNEILGIDHTVLVHLDVDPKETLDVMQRAKEHGARIFLNLSPFKKISKEVLSMAEYLIMNEDATAKLYAHLQLGNDTDPAKQTASIARVARTSVITTLAAKGSVMVGPEGKGIMVPALNLDDIVDTAGAGACYCGTLAACLHNKMGIEEAMKRASATSSLACLKEGTYESYPYSGDVDEIIGQLGKVTTF